MQLSMFFALFVLLCGTFFAKSAAAQNISDLQRTLEAIRLQVFDQYMQMMLAEPMLSESDLQNGKQSLVRVGIGEPQYVLGLIYNSTIEKTVEMIRKFSSQELINHINYIDLLSSLEGVLRKPIHNSEFTTMLNQHLTLANIYIVDTTIDSYEPSSISWSYAFCEITINRVAFGQLTMQERSSLSKYLIYLRKQHWLETSGPYLRFLQEKAKAYEKYLPPGYTIPGR